MELPSPSLQGKLARKLPFPLLPLFAFRNPTLNCDNSKKPKTLIAEDLKKYESLTQNTDNLKLKDAKHCKQWVHQSRSRKSSDYNLYKWYWYWLKTRGRLLVQDLVSTDRRQLVQKESPFPPEHSANCLALKFWERQEEQSSKEKINLVASASSVPPTLKPPFLFSTR